MRRSTTATESAKSTGVERLTRLEIPLHDEAFAVNGFDDYFRQNVMGGERMRDAAREASEARDEATPLWKTGQTAPELPQRTVRRPPSG